MSALERVYELTSDCYNAVIALRQMCKSGDQPPEVLHQQMRTHIDGLQQRGHRMGFAHQDIQEIAYAVVALADEVALSGVPKISQHWMGNMLQQAYFDANVAGDDFFVRLDAHIAAHRYEVVTVYYLTLLLGFMGRFNQSGSEAELNTIKANVRSFLTRGGFEIPEGLSPAWERPHEAAIKPDRKLRLFWLPVIGVVLAVVLYIALSAGIASQAAALVETIERLLI